MASQWPPKKNTAFTLYFSLYKSDGTIIANPGTYTKKVSIDGAAVADITASVTEEDTTYGQLSVLLTSGEMNGDAIWIYIKDDTAGCVPFTCTLYTAGSLHDEMKADTAAILVDTGTTLDGRIPAALVSGRMDASVGAVASGAITAAALDATVQARLGIVAYGTAQAATGTTLQLAAASAFADDELLGAVVVITGGTTGVGQSRMITDYVSSTDTATVDTWTTTPTGTITYVVFAAAPASATSVPSVNVAQVAGTTQTAGDLAALITTIDGIVDTIVARVIGTIATGTHNPQSGDAFARLGAPAGASVSADIAAIEAQTDDIGVAGAGLTALASAADLSTVAGYLDTEIAAIKAKTDNLPAAPAAVGDLSGLATAANLATVDTVVDGIATTLGVAGAGLTDLSVNVAKINNVTIIGDGSGTPFDVA